VIARLNDAMTLHVQREQIRVDAERQARRQHERQVAEGVARLRFDQD